MITSKTFASIVDLLHLFALELNFSRIGKKIVIPGF